MSVFTKQATLNQDVFTLLHRTRWRGCRVTVTGIAGESSTIVMQKKTRGGLISSKPVDATEISVSLIQAIPAAEILGKAPTGVGALDITYEVRTDADV